jgi:hypothetical protein
MPIQIADIPCTQDLDRITYNCNRCHAHGIIRSAAVNRKFLVLEGQCPSCGKRNRAVFDILAIDDWLHYPPLPESLPKVM